MGGVSGISALEVQPFGGLAKFDFDADLVTFTAAMAKRAGSVFAAAPIVQGDPNHADELNDDLLQITRGSQIAGYFYGNVDGTQGTVIVWWTPEYSTERVCSARIASALLLQKQIHNQLEASP